MSITVTDNTLTLTTSARDYLKRKLQKNKGLRIQLKKSGCSGWLYHFEEANQLYEGEMSLLVDGIKIFVQKDLVQKVFKATKINYVREGLNGYLTCINPNEGARCGCGESFTLR